MADAYPTAVLSKDEATASTTNFVNDHAAVGFDKTRVVKAYDTVILPSSPNTASLDIATWDAYKRGNNWAVREYRAGPALDPIHRAYIVRSAPLFDVRVDEAGDVAPWREAACDLLVGVSRQSGFTDLADTQDLLRRMILKPTWHPELAARRKALVDSSRAAFNARPGPGMAAARVAFQNSFVAELKSVFAAHPTLPPTLFDVAVDVLTAAASDNSSDPRLSAAIQALLSHGFNMIFDDPGIDILAVKTFLYVASFHSKELGEALPKFVADLIEGLVRRPDGQGHALLLDYFNLAAAELGSSRHGGLIAYASLERTFLAIAASDEFRGLLAMGPVGIPERMHNCAPALARLAARPDKASWKVVLDLAVNATAVDGFFDTFIGQGLLWDGSPDTPPEQRCKLDRFRLGFLFKHILKLREEADRPDLSSAVRKEKREAAVRCFAALTRALVKLNAIHLLEVAIRPDVQAGPVNAALVRRFQADDGMRFPFLASDAVPLDVLFSNGLWSAYTIVHGLVRDDSGAGDAAAPATPGADAAAVVPPSLPAGGAAAPAAPAPAAPAPAASVWVSPAAQIMKLFVRSIANPVLSVSAFELALTKLAERVNGAVAFATTVLAQIGEHAPAGTSADGRLVPVEAWVQDTVTPTLSAVMSRAVSLYPRVGAVDEEFLLQCVEQSVATKPAVRQAVADFTGCMLLFQKFKSAAESLGEDVQELIGGILDRLSAALQRVDVLTTREPAASDAFESFLRSIDHFMRSMRDFRRDNMVSIVNRRIPLLPGAVQLLRTVAAEYWRPADIRSTSDALAGWSTADLLRFSFLEQAGGAAGPVDFNRAILFDAPDNAFGLAAAAVAAAFPGDDAKVRAVERALLAHVHFHNAQGLAMACLTEIDGIVNQAAAAGSPNLAAISSKFQAIIGRILDKKIFSMDDFSVAFRERNADVLARLGAPPDRIKDVLSRAELEKYERDTLGEFPEQFNNVGGVPIRFILPSQLIAVCVATRLAQVDCLLRLGTGQGKSIVLGLTALEAFRNPLGAQPTRVIVLTTFDHLAKRDHDFAGRIFAAAGTRSIAVTSDPTSVVGFADAKIVYANVLAVDALLRAFVLQQANGEALSADELAFVHAFYNIDGASYTVLLDEFDLILDDLRKQEPFVAQIPKGLLTRIDVQRNSRYYRPLSAMAAVLVKSGASHAIVDQTHGETFHRVHYYESKGGEAYYNLLPSVFRLPQFLAGAKRIMGVSGSAEEAYAFSDRPGGAVVPCFSLNYSHDPSLFDTRIVPDDFAATTPLDGSAADLRDATGIWCHTRRVIGDPASAAPTPTEVDEWVQCLVDNARVVTRNTRGGSNRPILIIAPSVDKTFVSAPGTDPVPLVDRLVAALRAAFSADAIFVPPTNRDLNEAEIQRIGNAGLITVGDLTLSRGIDIRPSADIPGGLHVIIGTEVAHKRLLKQMIGRTGRIGMEGSYSIITLHRVLSAPSSSNASAEAASEWWMGALHHLTSLGLAHLSVARAGMTPAERKTWAQCWLIFLHGCERRGIAAAGRVEKGEAAAPEWCIPPEDFTLLEGLAPRSAATAPFYERLLALKAAGPQPAPQA